MLDLMMAPIPAISLLGQLRLVSAPKSFIGDLDLLRHAVYGLTTPIDCTGLMNCCFGTQPAPSLSSLLS